MNRFKKLRKEKHLTQAELIKQYNQRYNRTYSIPALSLFENGRRLPELGALQDFADFFDVPVDYLLGRSDIRYELLGNTKDPNHPWHQQLTKVENSNVAWNPPPEFFMDPETGKRVEAMNMSDAHKRIILASKDLSPEELDRIADLVETMAKAHK